MTNQTYELSENNKPIKNVAEYLKAIEELTKSEYGKFAFRGQGKISFQISSSAARRLNIIQSDPDEQKRFIDYNNELISSAKMKGYHRKGIVHLEELELLAELQHNGAATGLIDFTYSSLIALYFAASNIDDEDGAVHIVNTHGLDMFKQIQSHDIKNTFENLLAQNEGKLWVWEPSDLNNRIPKQHSTFIFGKPVIDKELAKTIIIDKKEKSKILFELLNFHNIDAFTLFNDLTGFARENSFYKPYVDPRFLKIMNKVDTDIYSISRMGLDFESRIKLLDQALELDKNSLEALYLRSSLKLLTEDARGAIQDCSKIIELSPDSSGVYFTRAVAKKYLNDFEGAMEDINTALELDPDHEDAYNLRESLMKCVSKEN